MSSPAGRSPALPVVATVGAGVCVGVLALLVAGTSGAPLVAPVLVLAVAAGPVALARPLLAVLALAVEDATNLGTVVANYGVSGLHTALLALALTSLVLAVARGRLRLQGTPVLGFAMLYLAVQAIAGLQASSPSESVTAVTETGKDVVLLAVVTAVVAGSTGAVPLARVLVGTLAVLALLTAAQQFLLGNSTTFGGLSNVPLAGDLGTVTARHSGPQLDVNFWGRVLVLAVPLALSLAAGAPRRAERAGWLGALLALVTGIYLTGSRGALLALVVAAAAWLLLAGPRYRRLLLLSPLLLAVLAVPGVGTRLATLTELGASTSLTRPDPSLEGRRTAQAAGVRMVTEHPLTGVGPGRFATEMPDYQRRYALAASAPLEAHNLYLQQAAEGGLPLLLAWLALLASGVFTAVRARVLLRRYARAPNGGPSAPALLADGVLAALAGWSMASVFLHLATFRTLLLVLSIGVGLDALARRAVPAATS